MNRPSKTPRLAVSSDQITLGTGAAGRRRRRRRRGPVARGAGADTGRTAAATTVAVAGLALARQRARLPALSPARSLISGRSPFAVEVPGSLKWSPENRACCGVLPRVVGGFLYGSLPANSHRIRAICYVFLPPLPHSRGWIFAACCLVLALVSLQASRYCGPQNKSAALGRRLTSTGTSGCQAGVRPGRRSPFRFSAPSRGSHREGRGGGSGVPNTQVAFNLSHCA